MRKLLLCCLLAAGLNPGSSHADSLRKLTGPQIGVKLAGMEFSDDVHWREVYERGGRLRSYDMGRARIGKWRSMAKQLCVDAENTGADECYDVWLAGEKLELRRDGSQPIAGILRRPTDPVAAPKK